MATVSRYPKRNCWRVSFAIHVNATKKIRRAKYSKTQAEAKVLSTQLIALETAARTGIGRLSEIEDWINRGWLKAEEAEQIFVGYGESAERKRRVDPEKTDYQQILSAFDDYSASISKGGGMGRDHGKNLSQARQVIAWLERDCPDLAALTPDIIREHLLSMRGEYSEWSLHHFLTKMRLLLDQAVKLGMIGSNAAREVSLRRDLNLKVKATKVRRILSADEAQHLLACSLTHRKYLNGGMPTIVRLGLYAGMRNEEMCWLKWSSIDWENRIINVQESVCGLTGESWVPKDFEARRLGVKHECVDYLKEERQRQDDEDLLGPFILPAGSPKKREEADREKPLHPDTPSKAFAKMIRDEEMDPGITVYSLRHTYATMALRNSVDLRTVQHNMGHSDIRTTMDYLHYLDPEEHPMDNLPY